MPCYVGVTMEIFRKDDEEGKEGSIDLEIVCDFQTIENYQHYLNEEEGEELSVYLNDSMVYKEDLKKYLENHERVSRNWEDYQIECVCASVYPSETLSKSQAKLPLYVIPFPVKT